MKVLYDSHIFANQKIGGVSRYHYELIVGLRRKGIIPMISGKFVKNLYLKNDLDLRHKFIADPKSIFGGLNKLLIRQQLQKTDKYDLYHPSETRPYLLKHLPAGKPMVFTIHDMIPEKIGNIDPLSSIRYHFAKRASKIIAVSDNTKKDIIESYNFPPEKIEVIHHGSALSNKQVSKPHGIIFDKYILFVGGRGNYKNFEWFINSIAPLLEESRELALICAGGKPFTTYEKELITNIGLHDRVRCLVGLSDSELAYLYSNTEVFVFPSLYEGFGIPILEAWACKAPVILSNSSCFPEVAGDGALFFEPGDQDSLLSVLRKVMKSSKHRQLLIEKGTKCLNNYSWELAIKQTIQVYQSIL